MKSSVCPKALTILRKGINQEDGWAHESCLRSCDGASSHEQWKVTLWRRLRKGPCGGAGVAVVWRVLSRRHQPPLTCDLDVARCGGRRYGVHKPLPWPRHK